MKRFIKSVVIALAIISAILPTNLSSDVNLISGNDNTIGSTNFSGNPSPDIRNKYSTSIIPIYVSYQDENNDWQDSTGTGFFISNTKLVTAAHVLNPTGNYYCDTVSFRLCYYEQNGDFYTTRDIDAKLIAKDNVRDIAILELDKDEFLMGNTIYPVELDTTVPEKDTPIEFFNYFYVDPEVLCNGKIIGDKSTIEAKYKDNPKQMTFTDLIEISGNAYSGASGSPILYKGKVVGMLEASSIYRGKSLAYGTKAKYIQELLDKYELEQISKKVAKNILNIKNKIFF